MQHALGFKPSVFTTSICMCRHHILSLNARFVLEQALTVSLSDAAGKRSQEYPAIVLGTDADHDLAVLKIDASADVLRPIRCWS